MKDMREKKIASLTDSLFKGDLLEKNYAKIQPSQYESDEVTVYILYAHYNTTQKEVEFYGWGNKLMKSKNFFTEITTNPEWWNTSKRKFEDRPWIPKQVKLF